MKCQCGQDYGNAKKHFNVHRQQCSTFWNAVKTEMERISTELRGKVTPVSTYEWDTYRDINNFPTKKSLIDWCGSWTNVQNIAGLGLSRTGPKTGEAVAIVPNVDEFVEMIIDLSDSYYGNGFIISGNVYDNCRPVGWPMYQTWLGLRGYDKSIEGWRKFIHDHSGLQVVSNADAIRYAYERRETAQANKVQGFDYRNPQDEQYIAATYDPGFAICQATYERTGRMILR